MNQRLNVIFALIFALAVGLLGGGILSHYLSPMPVLAQSGGPLLISPPAQRVALMTGLGIKLGDMDLAQGTIKLFPIVTVHVAKTDQTVTLELTAKENSK